MRSLKTLLLVFSWLLVGLWTTAAVALSADNPRVELAALDPPGASTLGSNELLYVLIRYTSEIPVRFQAIAMREDVPLEFGATRSPAALHAPGDGEALVWVGYLTPTHVDAIMVTVLDEEWREIKRAGQAADVTWRGEPAAQPRQVADWVTALMKAERRKLDFVYDPAPQKHGDLYDLVFFLTIAAIPAYVLLQAHMLWRYRYRWRELAVMPIFPYLIVAFYALVGLDIETALLVTFLFRYTPLALLYLVCLWLAKRFWQHKLPPPKLYKPPKV